MNGFAIKLLLLLAAVAAPFALGEAGVQVVAPAQALEASPSKGSGLTGNGVLDDVLGGVDDVLGDVVDGVDDVVDGVDGADGAPGSDGSGAGGENSKDDTSGDDKSQDEKSNRGGNRPTPKLRKPREPRRGESMNAAPERGTVTVRLPGSDAAVPLENAASIPVGSVLNARAGAVSITAAASPAGGTQRATFSGGAFVVAQPRTSGVTDIRLRGGSFRSCRTKSASVSRLGSGPLAGMAARRPIRKLWGSGKGRFRTRGRHGAATVRGTKWMTADTCKGTLVRVRRGVVDVRDFARRRTVVVRAGEQHLVRRPAAKRRSSR